MRHDLSEMLDESLKLIHEGATIEECVARHPEYAEELRPLLETAVTLHRVPQPTPRPEAMAAGKQRMLDALAEKKRQQEPTTPSMLARLGAIFTFPQKRALAWQLPLAAAAIALLVVGGLLVRSLLVAPTGEVATLAAATGVVEVKTSGSEGWEPVTTGHQIAEGALIRTGPASTAEMAFFDGSVTALGAESTLAILQMESRGDHGKVIVLQQELGRARHSVASLKTMASRFEVRTPAAVTVVRGTQFTVEVDQDGTTQVEVEEGLVEVTAQETTVQIQAGQTTTVRRDQVPAAPQTVTPFREEPSREEQTPSATPDQATEPSPSTTSATESPSPDATELPSERTETPLPTTIIRTPTTGETASPKPPEQTNTPQPPGLTRTPEPPGQTHTPEPPGQTRSPQPPTATARPTDEPEPTSTSRPTRPTTSPTPSPPPQPTETPEPTATPNGGGGGDTPTPPTSTPTATSTPTWTPTATSTWTPTATSTWTPTATFTPTPTPTFTPTPTATSTPTPTPTTHVPPGLTHTPQPPGQTRTPGPPGGGQ